MNTSPLSSFNARSWRNSDAQVALKPLTPADFGEAQVSTDLKPLTFADHVVGSKTPDHSTHGKLVAQTQKWVAQTFYGTIMKQMHDSPFKSEMFSGGRGGEAFGGLMDQHLADRMAKSANNKLVNGIVRRIEARTAYAKQSKPVAEADTTNTEGSVEDATATLRA